MLPAMLTQTMVVACILESPRDNFYEGWYAGHVA